MRSFIGILTDMKKSNIYSLFKFSYIAFFILVVARDFLKQTMISSEIVTLILRYGIFMTGALTVIKILFDLFRSFDYKDLIIVVLCPLAILISGIYMINIYVIAYALIIAGAKNIKPRTILWTFFYTSIILSVITIGLCLAGNIPNVVTYRDGSSNHARRALGFNYATNLTSHILAIVFCWACIRLKKITKIEIAIVYILSIFCYIIAEARISAACILAVAVIFTLSKALKVWTVIERIVFNKITSIILIISPVLYALAGFVLGILYIPSSSFWNKIDHFSSERISQIHTTFVRYPLTWLGHTITDVGTQLSGQKGISDNYYVINNSYCSVLYKFGIIAFVAVMLIMVILAYNAAKKQNTIALLIVLIAGGFFFFEHRLLEISNNPFLILLFCSGISLPNKISDILDKYKNQLKQISYSIIISISVEVLIFNYSSILSLLNDPVSFADCQQNAPGVYYTENETMACDDTLVIEALNIPTFSGLESAYINLNIYDKDNPYRIIPNYKYKVNIYNLDQDDINSVKTLTFNTDKPSSFYSAIEIDSFYQNVRFEFLIDREYQFTINEFEFNGIRPVELVYARLCILFVILLAGYNILLMTRHSKKQVLDK